MSEGSPSEETRINFKCGDLVAAFTTNTNILLIGERAWAGEMVAAELDQARALRDWLIKVLPNE